MKAKNNTVQKALLTALGGAGYLAWVVQLLVLVALYFQSFKDSSVGQVVFPVPSNDTPPPKPAMLPDVTLPTSGPFLIVMVVLGLVFVAFAAYLVFVRYIPAVNKTAITVVHKVAEQAVVQTERHSKTKLPVRKRRILSARIVWWLKVGISLLPLIVVLLIAGSPLISKQSAVFIMAVLSLWAILCFVTQATLARFWRISTSLD